MRNLIRRTTVLASAVAVILGAGIGVAAAQPQRSVMFDPSSHAFGTVVLGESADWLFTVTNDGGRGTGPVTFRIAGDRSVEFSVTTAGIPARDRCMGGIGPGSSCQLKVDFSPQEPPGPAEVTLEAFDNKGVELGSATLTGTSEPPGPCVENKGPGPNSGQSYPNLQEAVNAAETGDTLLVTGTCDGTTDVSQSLTITGETGAVLNGLGQGSVLSIRDGADVTLNTLTITDGSRGGINNSGTVTLNGTEVTGNEGTFGGGIYNSGATIFNPVAGEVTLENDSTVSNNTATGEFFSGVSGRGGGIYNDGMVTLENDSTVSNNTAASIGGVFPVGGAGGGIYSGPEGTVTLTDSAAITDNTAEGTTVNTGIGGGIFNNSGGIVTMNGGSTITGNTAEGTTDHLGLGGGIWTDSCDGLQGSPGPQAGVNVDGNNPDNIFSATSPNHSC